MGAPVLSALKRARNVLVSKGWTRGAWARAEDGSLVHTGSPRAQRYCAMGTLRVSCTPGTRMMSEATTLLDEHTPEGFCTIEAYNDDADTTLRDVLGVFDAVIKDLERGRS